LLRYLMAACQRVEPALGEDVLDLISTRGGGLDVGLTMLINRVAALDRHLVMILDDFQVIRDRRALHVVDSLVKHGPDNLHLLIATRDAFPLNLAALRISSRVIEVGAGELRFTEDEIAAFFKQTLGMALPHETVQKLQIRTDGWAAGLQMAALSLRDNPDPDALLAHLEGGAHVLVDFLASEVLDRQPADVRQFLLRSSFLDTLSGPLCEAVVDPGARAGYGAVMLDRLEQANLFIMPLDERHEWYRYHRLFADVLRHLEAEACPSEIPDLHKRAALWHEEHGNLDEAIAHAQASDDLEWMADMVERNCHTLIRTGEIHALSQRVSTLPSDAVRRRPRLAVAYAWAALAEYRLDLARVWIDELEQTYGGVDGRAQPPVGAGEDEDCWAIRGGLAACQSTLALMSGDLERAARFSQMATRFSGVQDPFVGSFLALGDSLCSVFSGDSERAIEALRGTIRLALRTNNLLVTVIAVCQLAETQALQGQLSKALNTLERVQFLAPGPGGKALPLAGLADIGRAAILLERNLLQEAHDCVSRGRKSTRALWPLSHLDAMVIEAQIHQARGDLVQCRSVLEEASRLSLSTDSSQWDDKVVSAVAVRLALQRGDLSEAAVWWSRGGFPDPLGTIAVEDYPYHVYEYLVLTQVHFLITQAQGSGERTALERACRLAEMLLPGAERFRRLTSQIEVLVQLALAQHALGDEACLATLLRALALGEPEGYRRVYLDEGARLRVLLAACASERNGLSGYLPSQAFIEDLIGAIDREVASKPRRVRRGLQQAAPAYQDPGEEPAEPLSPRELQVLSLIAEGKSNKEIASQLYLALNTVKRHAYNIYSKLNVTKRAEAISRGRSLGLIE